jgi:predicted RecB family nuclease
MSPTAVPRLSKSRYVAGLQCLKRLYWMVHEPNLAGPTDASTQALFDRGNEVGTLARTAFAGGVLVDHDHLHHTEAMRTTASLIDDRDIPALYEAAFRHQDVNVRVDILERKPRNRWGLVEVKSTSGVKDPHLPDVAIQKYVLEGCGLNLAEASVLHLDREYVYDGKRLDLGQLFQQSDVAGELKDHLAEIPARLKEQRKALAAAKPPKIDPGSQCNNPYPCPFMAICNEEPPDDWVGFLPGVGAVKRAWFEQNKIRSVYDIPADVRLSENQRRAIRCLETGEPYFSKAIRTDLTALEYPLCFMDFETFAPAIPRYRGMRPFDPFPFQWSVHIVKTRGARPTHHEFLAEDDGDPREGFLKSLLDVLYGQGHIVVYSSFEANRLKELAGWFPKYAKQIEKVRGRLWDLLPVVRAHVYHPAFRGSFSIKGVLPALVPGMTYEGMAVADGTMAGIAYDRMVRGDIPAAERRQIRKDLLAYCGQDTLAMVKLLDVLYRI